MNNQEFVYHGSYMKFSLAWPKRNIRVYTKDGKEVVRFDDYSFHATIVKWIGIAYTYDRSYNYYGSPIGYKIGVNLYTDDKTLIIYGTGSLEKSLEKLYGKGGYLHVFNTKDFFHTEGLGTLEVITQKPVYPVDVAYIADPVLAMKQEGINFTFIELT